MAQSVVVKPVRRGAARAVSGQLVKVSVTLPRELLLEVDRAVLMRKQLESPFNRSALVEEVLRAYVDAVGGGSDE